MVDPASIAASAVTNAVNKVTGWSIDKAMQQAEYLFHYKTYLKNCDSERDKLEDAVDLSTNDALNLFLSRSGNMGQDSSQSVFKKLALDIVKECGRLPVAIVPIAITLNSQPQEFWEASLTRLQNFNPLSHDVDNDLIAAYKSLSLSFDHLDEKAQNLLLACSLFPEDFEIPTELLRRIAIGLGLGGEAGGIYNLARSRVLEIERKLLDSSLLSKARKEQHVKMHDLVREVVLKQANTKVQAIMSSDRTPKENIRYSSWSLDFIPIRFGASNELEFLLAWIDLPDRKTTESRVPDTLFEGMTSLKVLLLFATVTGRSSLNTLLDVPLPVHSFKSLTSIQTLILSHWSLGDISVMGNLQCLESLQLTCCKILELPNQVSQLMNLRLLGLVNCVIRRNDPLKVIERCKKLEDLYFESNLCEVDAKNKVELHHSALKRYHIIGHRELSHYSFFGRKVSRCFKSRNLKESFSEATFKSLVATTQSLELGDYGETGWTNLIPDIVSMEDGGMEDLKKLSLNNCSNIECLIHTKDHQPGVTIFSKLVKLSLHLLKNVKELCCGPLPIDFLKQLETLYLFNCPKLGLGGTLFNSKIDLSKLKVITLYFCSMTYVFNSSVVQSLKQLETLELHGCR